ncbi:hypothetical protein HPB48_006178 [Haemaphysalis longicornis]|uniref:PG1 pseudoGTPase domain-containing protein n=1 Tax=Haemaphysalis longicornis TaxID=44386 RepID=A0A9J6GDN0_HAELO|nr:hypothetical protein HPB48_006178 [Haemaphysalis longicornis]
MERLAAGFGDEFLIEWLFCTSEDTVVEEFFIPKGTAIFPNIYAVHHDPKLWKEPFKFDPSRFLNTDETLIHPKPWYLCLSRLAQYALDFRIIDGDVGLPHNSFRTEPLPHGCLCVYASHPGLEYIRESLEKILLANLEQEDRLPFHGLPMVMVFAGQGDFLREEGINRAKSLQCPFVDLGGGLDPVRLEQALCALVENIERRAGRLHI